MDNLMLASPSSQDSPWDIADNLVIHGTLEMQITNNKPFLRRGTKMEQLFSREQKN